MIVQYRIKNYGGKYYPQVRMKGFLFWGSWKKIAKHPSGFGLYPESNHEYPKDCYDCETIIDEYHKLGRHTVYAKIFPNQ